MKNKKLIFIFSMCIFLLCSCTQELFYESDTKIEETTHGEELGISITQKEPGGIENALSEFDYRKVAKLTVKGPINGTDIKCIRMICGADEYGNETEGHADVLDLSQAEFVSGGDPFYVYIGDNSETPIFQEDNELSRYAFGYCKMKEIKLPNSIQKFSSQAFYSCEFLETVNIPSSLKEIGRSVFCYCHKLYVTTPKQLITTNTKK